MNQKTIITAAITGAVHIPSMSDYLPITPQQIIEQAVGAAEAGAAVVHIHGRRKEDGKPTGEPAVMKEIADGVRKQCDVVVGITTGGAVGMTKEERLLAVPLVKPDLASCNAGSMNFSYTPVLGKIKAFKHEWEVPLVENTYRTAFSNTFEEIEYFVDTMQKAGTKPEFEVYDVGMLSNISYLLKKGVVKSPFYIQFVLGVMGGLPATVDNLLFLYNTARSLFGTQFVWSCGAAGRNQFNLMAVAMTLGGNVRIGLEDNLYIRKGVLSTSNAESVTKMKRIMELLDREPATPAEAREILSL